MANIPTLQFNESLRTGPIIGYADSADFAGGGPSPRDVAAIQQGIGDITKVLQRQKDAMDEVWVQDQTVQAQKVWTDKLFALQQAKNRGEDIDPDKVNAEFNQLAEDTFNNAPTHMAGTMFMEKMQPMGMSIYEHALNLKAQKVNMTFKQKMDGNLAALQEAAGANPANLPAHLENIDKTADTYGNAMPGMEGVAESARVDARANAITRAVDSAIQSDPALAVELAHSGVLDELHPDVADALKANADAAFGVNEGYTIAKMTRLREANMTSLMETGRPARGYNPMVDAAATSKNPDYAQAQYLELLDQQNFALKMYSVKSRLYGKSPEEASRFLESIKPAPGSAGFDRDQKVYDAAVSAYQAQQTALRQDPFKFSLGSPVVAGATERAQSYFQQAQAEQDPAKKQALLGSAQGEMEKAITASLDFQTKAGVPSIHRTVMSKEQATAQADTIRNGLLKEGLSSLANIESTYGVYTEQAFRDMQRLPAKGSELSSQYMVVVSHASNPVLAQVLLDSIKLDTSEVKDGAVKKSSLDAAIGDENVKALYQAVDSNDNLKYYMQATTTTSGNTEYAAGVQQTVLSYAKLLMMRKAPGADTPQGALKAASDHVIGNLYDFGHSKNGQLYAVPREGRTPDQLEKIHDGIRTFTKQLGDPAFLEARGVDMTQFAGDKSPLMNRLNANGLQDKSYWATLPDHSGVALFANDEAHATFGMPGQPIRLKDGSIFKVTFEELSRYAAEQEQARQKVLDSKPIFHGILEWGKQ